MSVIRVATQGELDAALASATANDTIVIQSPAGLWLTVRGKTASNSVTVTASDSATVRAYDRATVTAYDSATVWASNSVTVTASDSATVWAYDSATVWAYDSATVRAYDSATVWASNIATVTASGSATVRAYDGAHVNAGSHVALHLHSRWATVDGGVLIDHTAVNLSSDPAEWLAYHGVTVTAGYAVLHKAVNGELVSDHGTAYPMGQDVTAPDWRDDDQCGHGLHLSPQAEQARLYLNNPDGSRYLACRVKVTDIRPLLGDSTPKCKVPTLTVLHEVDMWGREVTR